MDKKLPKRIVVLLLAALAALVTAAEPAFALPPGWDYRHATFGDRDEVAIDIDGSNVLYIVHGPMHETSDILVHSAGTGTSRLVADDVVLRGVPVIKRNWVVYSAGASSTAEIYVWNLASGTTRRVTNNAVADLAPSVDGSILAWQRHDGTDWEIYWIDLSGGPEHHLPYNSVHDFDPHVNGDWIVYRQEDPDPASEIGEVYLKAYNWRSDAHISITSTSDPIQNICCCSNYVAFQCIRNFPTSSYSQIMLHDLGSGRLRALTSSLNDNVELGLDSGYAVWATQRRSETARIVKLHDLKTDAEVALAFFSDRLGRNPDVSHRWVVFEAWDGHDWEIIGYHIPTRRLFQITSDGVDSINPRIYGDRVIFTSMATPTSGDVDLARFYLPFIDVPASHAYRSAIENLYFLGIMSGYDSLRFGLNDYLLRAQFAKIIVLTTGVSCSESDCCPFRDVPDSGPESLYPDNFIAAAWREGLTRGTSATNFSPWNHILRVQVMTMIVRAAQRFIPGGLVEPPATWDGHFARFEDPTHGHNAKLAEYNGLLRGIDLTNWDEWKDATRGEVAQMLWNLWEKIYCGG